jgi:hypothetical protein
MTTNKQDADAESAAANVDLYEDSITELNDFPVEIVYSILELLDYKDKYRLQSVCRLWNDVLKDILLCESPLKISETLQLHIAIDPYYRGIPGYEWFIKEKESTLNLCIKIGWRILELDMLEHEKLGNDENVEGVMNKEQISKRAFESVIDCPMRQILFSTLHQRFVDQCLQEFEKKYKIKFTPRDVGADIEHMPVLLVTTGSDPKDLYLEFTLNDPDTFNPHDYKMLREVDAETGIAKWIGLGDRWEFMDPLDIWNKSESKYNYTCNNVETSSISYIFEFVVYAVYM